jgi:hypothetical protein
MTDVHGEPRIHANIPWRWSTSKPSISKIRTVVVMLMVMKLLPVRLSFRFSIQRLHCRLRTYPILLYLRPCQRRVEPFINRVMMRRVLPVEIMVPRFEIPAGLKRIVRVRLDHCQDLGCFPVSSNGGVVPLCDEFDTRSPSFDQISWSCSCSLSSR